MHHSIAIFDGRQLANDSFSWARSTSSYNQGNITMSSDAAIIESFSRLS